MQRFVSRIVEMMKEEMLFSWQGGPIILLQVGYLLSGFMFEFLSIIFNLAYFSFCIPSFLCLFRQIFSGKCLAFDYAV